MEQETWKHETPAVGQTIFIFASTHGKCLNIVLMSLYLIYIKYLKKDVVGSLRQGLQKKHICTV